MRVQQGNEEREAMLAELRQMSTKGVFEPVPIDVKPEKIIPSKIFVKLKRDAAGQPTKYKARLVADGSRQIHGAVEDTTSPTIGGDTLRLVLAISGSKGHTLSTIDVEGAYLECVMDAEVFMRLDARLSNLMIQVDRRYESARRPDGTIVVRLLKALYGTIQAAALWYQKLSGVLKDHGFRQNPYDKCLFSKQLGDERILTTIHVDDVMVSSSSGKGNTHVEDIMRGAFSAINVSSGTQIDYLGTQITTSEAGVEMSMPGYARECVSALKEHTKVTGYVSPGDDKTFTVDENSPLLPVDKKEVFHMITAKVLYLAHKSRPDLLAVTSFLCSRVSTACEQDWQKLERLIGYISKTVSYGISYKRGAPVEPIVYADASHMTHNLDGRGRTGIVITMAGGAVCFRSNKQSLVAQSSTEAEIVALAEGTNHLVSLRLILGEMGLPLQRPSVVYQDNQSTILLIKNDRTRLQRSKHIDIKYFVARDRVRDGTIEIVYLPSEEMPADILTKGVDSSTLQHLLPKIMHPKN
jgi:histone deacetylase 1/2